MRHNRGFGIQSPVAFRFVTNVLKETHPFYAYDKLNDLVKGCKEQNAGYCRRIFRIANYLHPDIMIIAGAGGGAVPCALAAACGKARIYIIGSCSAFSSAVNDFLQKHSFHEMAGNESLQPIMEERTGGLLIYIGDTPSYAETLKTAIKYANKHTVIIVEGIHKNSDRLALWEKTVKNPATVVTYDIYSAGIIFFDNEKQKQHYKLKL